MSLIPQATINAAAINTINREIVTFVRHQLASCFNLVMANPQSVLNAMGSNASTALTRYATMYAALAAIGEADGLTAPNFEVFQPQEDGTVIFVAPAEPEPDQ